MAPDSRHVRRPQVRALGFAPPATVPVEPLPALLLSERRWSFPFDGGFRPPIRRGAASAGHGRFLLPAHCPGGGRAKVRPRRGRMCRARDERAALPPCSVLEIRPWNHQPGCILNPGSERTPVRQATATAATSPPSSRRPPAAPRTRRRRARVKLGLRRSPMPLFSSATSFAMTWCTTFQS